MQDPTPPFVIEWAFNAFFTGLAAIGGFLGYVTRQVSRGETVRLTNAFVEALGSGFLGFICLLICKAMGLDTNWTGAIVGIMGWIGATAAGAVLERIIRARLGVDSTRVG